MFTLGVEFHTYTVIGRCPRTGRLGIGVTTLEMAVGSRVPYIRANTGAVATQASTDPRLGVTGLRLLELGYPAARVLAELETIDPYIENRQLAVIDRWGNAEARTGAENRDWAGHIVGEGWIAMGNALTSERTAQAMARSMRESADKHLESRLMLALEAGTDAGGQHGGQRSAALLVYADDLYPIADLRVDEYSDVVAELRRLFDLYQPLISYYTERPSNPTVPRP